MSSELMTDFIAVTTLCYVNFKGIALRESSWFVFGILIVTLSVVSNGPSV